MASEMMEPQGVETEARAIATKVADRCHGSRKPGQAPERYSIIWQAARLGAIDALTRATLSASKDLDR